MATGLKTACDAVLNKAVNSTPGLPGVATVATDRNGNIYEGVVGKRLASATAKKAATDLPNLDRQLCARSGPSITVHSAYLSPRQLTGANSQLSERDHSLPKHRLAANTAARSVQPAYVSYH